MTGSCNKKLRAILLGAGMLATLSLTGCQVDVGGQTLPSPWYMKDDIQYFPPGPQFKLSREAAAMREHAAEQQPQPGPRP